jgi:16S rRNA (uracil1498-N3)-methyltransferase
MPHHRYYLDTSFQENETVVLSADEFHHLARVSRTREGDCVELVNGRGQLAQARLTKLKKRDAELGILQVTEEIGPKTPLILAQALTRMTPLEWIIEKGTELNVTAFWLFPGVLSEKDRLSQAQFVRLKHLAISAMKQCGRLDLPSIELKPSLLKWMPMPGTLLFGNPEEPTPYLWELSLRRPLPAPVVLFIGPESGFDPTERDFLHNSLNVRGIRLHPNILRAETASLVILSLIQQYL